MTAETQTPLGGPAAPANGRYALVITLDRVEPAFYTGWEGKAESVKRDRSSMMKLLNSAQFAVTALENEGATRQAVINALQAAGRRPPGSHVVIYFSGHGVTLPDLNGDEPGVLRDGAWCLHDGMLVDDEVSEALANFNPGVRVVLISDSCYSGTIVAPDSPEEQEQGQSLVNEVGSKLAPVDIGERVYEAQQRFYDPILKPCRPNAKSSKAAVLVLSACDKNELALVSNNGGSLFTNTIVETWWGSANSPLNYKDLFVNVRETVSSSAKGQQNPQEFPTGNQPEQLKQELAFGGPPPAPSLADVPFAATADLPLPGIPGGIIEREAPPPRYPELR